MAKKKQPAAPASPTAVANALPPVAVEYDTAKGRTTKAFADAHEAKAFYTTKHKAGKNPKVLAAEGTPEYAAEKEAVMQTIKGILGGTVAPDDKSATIADLETPTKVKAKGKVPGVALMATRPFVAGQIIQRYGLAAGVTDAMVAELDTLYAEGRKANPVQSKYDLQSAWQAIRGFTGWTPDAAK